LIKGWKEVSPVLNNFAIDRNDLISISECSTTTRTPDKRY